MVCKPGIFQEAIPCQFAPGRKWPQITPASEPNLHTTRRANMAPVLPSTYLSISSDGQVDSEKECKSALCYYEGSLNIGQYFQYSDKTKSQKLLTFLFPPP